MRSIQRTPSRRRIALQAIRNRKMCELAEIDRALQQTTTRRIELLDELDDLREELWPRIPHRAGREPPDAEAPPLPPAHDDAIDLWGRGLRCACLAVLRRYGTLQLKQLHALLHHHGYQIASPTR
ncbi:MAG: hypothetical protein R2701_09865 [Acidimicrobiales bacterium]